MSKYAVKFINHASFCFENEEEILLIDPWFSGRIFNNSWALLKEEPMDESQIKKISNIFITHEHPDHLNWSTLKTIVSISDKKIKVYIPKRDNDNVSKALQGLGYDVIEAMPFRCYNINDRVQFYSYPEPNGHDSIQVFKVDGEVHVNQNDCYMPDSHLSLLKMNFPVIDYWWMQFSLAGHYANKDDHETLQTKGKDFHVNIFKHYYDILQPKTAIPFASYVYFCKKHNNFLNSWVVSLSDLVEMYDQIDFIIPSINEVLNGNNNSENIHKWEQMFSSDKVIYDPEEVEDAKVLSSGNRWLKNIKDKMPENIMALDLYDDERKFVLDFENKKCYFTNNDVNTIAILPKEELNFFLKFPWGADTLNITSCFEIYDNQRWRFLLEYKDSMYVR